jgi:hypothetical protein
MSLHLFRPPTPAPPSSGGTESVRTDPPESGRPSGTSPFYVQQMQDLLLAAEVIPGLSSAQYETLMVYSRGFYYACRKFYGVASRPWAEMSREGQRSYICAAWEQIRDFPPTRCIKCGGPCDDEGDLYCSKSCSIDAENNR